MTIYEFPKLPGKLCEAMLQTTADAPAMPNGWTPCHFLCKDFDVMDHKVDLIEHMFWNQVLKKADFEIPNDKVFFFQTHLTPPLIYSTYTHRMTRLPATHLIRNELTLAKQNKN